MQATFLHWIRNFLLLFYPRRDYSNYICSLQNKGNFSQKKLINFHTITSYSKTSIHFCTTDKKKSTRTKSKDNKTEGEEEVEEEKEENQAAPEKLAANNGSSQDVDSLDEDKQADVYYDSKKSFFDNISCEATEVRTHDSRPSRFQERKLNSETFGIPEHPNYRKFKL